ncbi:formylglycine-generating enzyme family protein [Arcticibacter eurypsychrophilus]|uniref:formylglycine-generating enzyme family protein n=1 Tax=Arcticibacter eurypsychrophilus TaxID=1434752 RepID=UPI000AC3B08A|nr:formylglycine-generating enzyme family protein [Arcticibacter eurypsychrophilus]
MIKRTLFIFCLTTASISLVYAANPAGMVKIQSGQYTPFFTEKGVKTVKVNSFYLDINAVTNAQYMAFVKSNPQWSKSKASKLYVDASYLKHWKSDFDIGADYNKLKDSPVTNVSWFAANAYSKWKGKRLPTVNEWEYVGNAPAVNNKRPIEKIILQWYSKPSPAFLPPVGSTFYNTYHVSDMHGLIWEWLFDFNSIIMTGDSRSNTAVNRELFCASAGLGAIDNKNYAAYMRYAFRGSLKAKYTVSNLGFRCAMDI